MRSILFLVISACLCVSLFYLAEVAETQHMGIRVNLSNSSPYYLFRSSKFDKISRGQHVIIDHPTLTYKNIGKMIAGLPGDEIKVIDGNVFINEEWFGKILKTSSSGKSYTPVLEQVIEDGYVYLYAPHEESFDSRYQEFGLIEISRIKESIWPIF